jgi:hypothetical protein
VYVRGWGRDIQEKDNANETREQEKQSAIFLYSEPPTQRTIRPSYVFVGVCVCVEMMMVYMMFYFCPIHDKYIE